MSVFEPFPPHALSLTNNVLRTSIRPFARQNNRHFTIKTVGSPSFSPLAGSLDLRRKRNPTRSSDFEESNILRKKLPSVSRQQSGGARPLPTALKGALDYKKMYERVSAMAFIGVWEYDLLKRELKWSDAVYDLFELPRGLPIDRATAVQFYSAESRVEMEALRAQAIESGGSFSIDIEVRTSRGTRRWINLTAGVEKENGISVRIFGTKQDITERKKGSGAGPISAI